VHFMLTRQGDRYVRYMTSQLIPVQLLCDKRSFHVPLAAGCLSNTYEVCLVKYHLVPRELGPELSRRSAFASILILPGMIPAVTKTKGQWLFPQSLGDAFQHIGHRHSSMAERKRKVTSAQSLVTNRGLQLSWRTCHA
jgi:hypothetical protein